MYLGIGLDDVANEGPVRNLGEHSLPAAYSEMTESVREEREKRVLNLCLFICGLKGERKR